MWESRHWVSSVNKRRARAISPKTFRNHASEPVGNKSGHRPKGRGEA